MPLIPMPPPGFAEFTNQLQHGALGFILLPPNPGFLGAKNYPFDGLSRDVEGIAMQFQDNGTLDGGDSANRTGILAFLNSAHDQQLLERFEAGGVMRRHPTQGFWADPKNCSRDQLLGFMAGCWRAGRTDIAKRLLDAHEARGNLCQNIQHDGPDTLKNPPIGDPLLPHHHMFMRVCAGQTGAHWELVGQYFLQVDIEAAAVRDDEINQLIPVAWVCGRLDHFAKFIPDYQERLNAYWGGWRGQPQIAAALGDAIRTELERYKGFITLPFPPLPVATVLTVVTIVSTAVEELARGDLPHVLNPLELAQTVEDVRQLVEAAIHDTDKQIRYYLETAPKLLAIGERIVEELGLNELVTNPLALLGRSSNSDQEEILNALASIEQKVEQVIAFLKDDLGAVVRQSTLDALGQYEFTRSSSLVRIELQPALRRMGMADVNATDALHLRNAAADVLTAADVGVKLHAGFAGLAAVSFLTVLQAGTALLRVDAKAHGPFVAAWCSAIRSAIAEGQLDASRSGSLAHALKTLPTLDDAKYGYDQIPPDTSVMYVYWGLVRTQWGPHTGHPNEWNATAFGARLKDFSEEHGWNIWDAGRHSEFTPQKPTRTDYLPKHGDEYKQYPWWPLSIDFKGAWVDEGRRMKAHADRLTRNGRKYMPRLALDAQIAQLHSIVASAQEMETEINKLLA